MCGMDGAGSSFAESVHCFGMAAKFDRSGHASITTQFCQRFAFAPYISGRIEALGGSVKTEAEVAEFPKSITLYQPRIAVMIAPLGVAMEEGYWDVYGQVDSTLFGDVMGSVWQVCIQGASKVGSLKQMEHTPYAETVGDRYLECGMVAVGEERGIISHCPMQFSSGQEFAITNVNRKRRLIKNSGVSMVSLHKVRNYELK